MRYALLNPAWRFDGSIYFGCRDPHLPLELGYAQALLEREGHDTLLLDLALEGIDAAEARRLLADFAPDITVIATAPSYLFWRCPPAELRSPQELLAVIRTVCGRIVAVGPHGSTTPRATLRKLGADAAVMGECETVLPRLAAMPWGSIDGIAWRDDSGAVRVQGARHMVDLAQLPALRWPDRLLRRHHHHHHRFDSPQSGSGAEIEASRGCPYACSFCAKQDHRDAYRRRPLEVVLAELDGLLEQGVGYVYFIDEIFLPNRPLLEALRERDVRFGIQTRIDLWKDDMIDLLGEAGCVTIEAGIESISGEGRALLDKQCRLSTGELTRRLIRARRSTPFVQASLIQAGADDAAEVEAWRAGLEGHGVWANLPVPVFPYPGSPDYTRLWGMPDDAAWERAVTWYRDRHAAFSDIQDDAPLPLEQLEHAPPRGVA